SKKTIPMEYDRLLKSYNDNVFIAGKDGKLGLINLDNKKLSEFSFDEFVFWTDSIALVRQSDTWTWRNLYTQAIIYGPVSEYKPILWTDNHMVVMIYKD